MITLDSESGEGVIAVQDRVVGRLLGIPRAVRTKSSCRGQKRAMLINDELISFWDDVSRISLHESAK